MDRRLRESISRGDVSSLHKLIEQVDKDIIKQTVPISLNTVLHLSAKFGHLDYAKEIVKLCPEMVSTENIELETPLHVACREGYLEITRLLLETDPSIVYKVNKRDESVLYVACERGKVDVVKYLMNFPTLLTLEVDMQRSSIHLAAKSGNTEIVKDILKSRPDFVQKKDIEGCTPLHLSCSKGQLETTRELLKFDSDLCLLQDNQGRIPLHHAISKGRINIIAEILTVNLECSELTTFNEETILHLAVKHNQFEVVKYLMANLNTSKLLNMQDCDGNTILHLATAGKLTYMVNHILKVGVDVNSLNNRGYTALDVAESDGTHSGALVIVPALLEAGAKRCDQLSPITADPEKQDHMNLTSKYLRERAEKQLTSWPNKKPGHRQDYYISPERHMNRRHHHHKPITRLRSKKIEYHKDGLRNARKTITIVAVLIATVTFTAGINPPGGFDQETGKALRGHHAAFKVFVVCNIVALFLSIGIVNILVSIIPITRKTMVKVLTVTHKVMWLSTLFMIAAYIAGVWTIMPNERRESWVLIATVLFGGGCTVLVLLGLGFMWVRHLHNKYKWKKVLKQQMKMTSDESPQSTISPVEELKMKKIFSYNSSNSDVDSSDHGYHLY